MSIATLKLDEKAKLEFGVSISGADANSHNTRFVIESVGKDYGLILPASIVEGGVEVIVPSLKGILNPGEHSVRLEVLVEGKIFVPLTDVIVFEPLVEVTAKKAAVTKESVEIKSFAVVKTEPIIVPGDEVLSEEQEKTEDKALTGSLHIVRVVVSESADGAKTERKIKVGGNTRLTAEARASAFYEKQGLTVHTVRYESAA